MHRDRRHALALVVPMRGEHEGGLLEHLGEVSIAIHELRLLAVRVGDDGLRRRIQQMLQVGVVLIEVVRPNLLLKEHDVQFHGSVV